MTKARHPRTSVITDGRTKDEDLPDVAPGEEFEVLITPQKFVVLHRILVREMTLVHLRIGEVDVPFARASVGDQVTIYRLGDLASLKKQLAEAGAIVAPNNTIAIPPATDVRVDVRVTLHNHKNTPAKPRAGLFVQEEEP